MTLPLWKSPLFEWHWRPVFSVLFFCFFAALVTLVVGGLVMFFDAVERENTRYKLQEIEDSGYEQAQHAKLYARGYLRGLAAPLPERQ